MGVYCLSTMGAIREMDMDTGNRSTFGPTLSALLILASVAFMMNPPSAAGATLYPLPTLSLSLGPAGGPASDGVVHWLAEGFVAYGAEPWLDRMDAIDTANARPRVDAVNVGGGGGPPFDLGPIRFGPITNLGYTRAVLDGHTAGFAAAFARPAGSGIVVSAGIKLKF